MVYEGVSVLSMHLPRLMLSILITKELLTPSELPLGSNKRKGEIYAAFNW